MDNLENTPQKCSLLFEDNWKNWAKLKMTMNKQVFLNIFEICVVLCCLFIVIYVHSINPQAEIITIFLICMLTLGICVKIFSIIESENFTSIQVYPKYIKYERWGRKQNWNLIYLEDINKIYFEKPKPSSKKRKTYKTFVVELKDGDIKTYRPTIVEYRLGIIANIQRNRIFLHVKHHNEFLSVLMSIYGDNKWKDTFTDTLG